MTVVIDIDQDGQPKSAALLRTARKLFDGEVFAQ
jgi:2-methylaconitate cis-trans-isomerase PrpF